MAKLTASGNADALFGDGGDGKIVHQIGRAQSIYVDPQSRIIVVGHDYDPDALVGAGLIARFDPHGNLDATFGDEGVQLFHESEELDGQYLLPAAAVFSEAQGDIILVGAASNHEFWDSWLSRPRFLVARYEPLTPGVVNLQAVAQPDGPVDLKWTDSGIGEAGFAIYRALDPADLDQPESYISAVGSNEEQFTDFGVEPNTTYWYRIIPFTLDNSGNKVLASPSNDVSVATFPVNTSYVIQETLRFTAHVHAARYRRG